MSLSGVLPKQKQNPKIKVPGVLPECPVGVIYQDYISCQDHSQCTILVSLGVLPGQKYYTTVVGVLPHMGEYSSRFSKIRILWAQSAQKNCHFYMFLDKIHLKLCIFSCEEAALEVQMSVCVSV